jgi:hypothetical protein
LYAFVHIPLVMNIVLIYVRRYQIARVPMIVWLRANAGASHTFQEGCDVYETDADGPVLQHAVLSGTKY